VAREWRQDYEWSFHAPIALKQGIAQSMIDAVAAGRRPAVLTADEAIIYDFTIELLRDKQVSDPVYARARSRFGDKGVVDIVGLAGYYTLQAMILNVARTPAVAGAPTLPK
jgi:4-carboxymuconolactone decarboxylase